ncbi:MAG: hypothetical protein JO190_08745 [Candidatus Eremiobacteraeota bacterium]|nr:hypothetical protein [Candidatus Eremiobacteraeota bacterium]MBV8498496.1 hypothetical protein [Candidatus Eremiobacteraeota bacterium]
MATATKLERDAVALDPKHYSVEAETDAVRVVRIRYGGREKSVMHQHPRGVGIFLTDADFTFAFPDGRAERVVAKRGDFLNFDEPWEHNPENNTDQAFEAIYVELK